ncbi:MAG TPA: TlpA disulfide reductase family protein, partial [Pirellulales bacterium]|nr:TlpA disulfide reductase family protein [Pirellulales bacterium]
RYGTWAVNEALRNYYHRLRYLAIGRQADNIEGSDVEGSEFSLADLRGKVVMLDFWVDWCPYCREMYPVENKLVAKLADQPFALIGINADERPTLEDLTRRNVITWRNFHDGPKGPITERWQVEGFPTVYLVDEKGVVRAEQVTKFDLHGRLGMVLGDVMLPPARDLVPFVTPWNYLSGTVLTDDAWRTADFDDSAWEVGNTPIGFGWGDEATKLKPDSIVTYFRRTFEVSDKGAIKDAVLELECDDGAIVFLNGREICRHYVAGDASPDEPAGAACPSNGRSTHTIRVDPAVLVDGKNVLAVEVRQESMDSADLRFELALSSNFVAQCEEELAKKDSPIAGYALDRLNTLDPDNAALTKAALRLFKKGDAYEQFVAMDVLLRRGLESNKWKLDATDDKAPTRKEYANSWSSFAKWIARQPRLAPDDYEEALDAALVADKVLDNDDTKVARAWLQYRRGEYKQALEILGSTNRKKNDASPSEIACRAALQFKTGNKTFAATLARAESHLKEPKYFLDKDQRALVREVRTLIGDTASTEPSAETAPE